MIKEPKPTLTVERLGYLPDLALVEYPKVQAYLFKFDRAVDPNRIRRYMTKIYKAGILHKKDVKMTIPIIGEVNDAISRLIVFVSNPNGTDLSADFLKVWNNGKVHQ